MSDQKPKRVPDELSAEAKEEIRRIVEKNKALLKRLG